MTNKEFMQEGMDLKRLALCLKKKLGVILLITLVGALLGSGIYLLVRQLNMKTEWQAQSKFYMQFIYTGDALQSYNGYTWNDLIHADPVMDKIAAIMDLEHRKETREEVGEAIKGEIISDVRLLTVTVTTNNPGWTTEIQRAMEEALLLYAKEQKEITSMELIRSTEPERVVWDDRTVRAAVSGGVLFLAISIFVWLFYYILDDSLYVIADGEKRYPFPLLGLLVKNKEGENVQPYAGELAENVSHLLGDLHKITFLSVEDAPFTEKQTSRTAVEAKTVFDKIMKEKINSKSWETVVLKAAITNGIVDGKIPNTDGIVGGELPNSNGIVDGQLHNTDGIVGGELHNTDGIAGGELHNLNGTVGEELRDSDGIILVVPFGGRNGKKIDRAISFLQNQDCKIQGILITEGEAGFWKSYYGSKKEKAEKS